MPHLLVLLRPEVSIHFPPFFSCLSWISSESPITLESHQKTNGKSGSLGNQLICCDYGDYLCLPKAG